MPIRHRPLYNRVAAVMTHVSRYSFQGQARLAMDAGVARSSISRLVRGVSHPTYQLAAAITAALERHLGRRIDPRELFSDDANYPTKTVCELVGCPGCLPDQAYDEDFNLRPSFRGVRPGQWDQSVGGTRFSDVMKGGE